MISDLLQNILLLIATGLNFLLSPIDNLISTYVPQLDTALTYISAFFSHLIMHVPIVCSFTGLTDEILSIIIVGFLAPTLISIIAFPIKLGIKWFNMLKIG